MSDIHTDARQHDADALRNWETHCSCPTCRVSRAIDELQGATETWLERDGETSMAYHYLLDEVQAVCDAPWWRSQRRRLRKAFEVARPTHGNDA